MYSHLKRAEMAARQGGANVIVKSERLCVERKFVRSHALNPFPLSARMPEQILNRSQIATHYIDDYCRRRRR